MPVLKKLDEKKLQPSIRNYFNTTGLISNKEVAVSKRVRQAINKMSKDYVEDDKDEATVKKVRKPRTKKVAASDDSNQTNEKKPRKPRKVKASETVIEVIAEGVASTSNASIAGSKKKVPDFTPPIKQRQKNDEDMEKNKLKAIELFKRTRSISLKKGKE